MIELAYKWSFEWDSTTGELREKGEIHSTREGELHNQVADVELPHLSPLPSVDKHMRQVLQHARELASASEATWSRGMGSSIPRGKRNWRNKTSRVRSARERWTLREIAFAALSVGVTMGALLIAALHFLLVFAPLGIATSGAASTATQVQIPSNKMVQTAVSDHVIVIPPVTIMMYEDGVFATLSNAQKALADVHRSGVNAVISAKSPYHLLLGPVLQVHGDPSFDAWLRRAEVPYFVKPYSTSKRTISLPAGVYQKVSPQVLSNVESLIVLDSNILQGLFALNSNYQVPQLDTWETQSATLAKKVTPTLSSLGSIGIQIATFHSAVEQALNDLHDIENPSSDLGKIVLTKAFVTEQKI